MFIFALLPKITKMGHISKLQRYKISWMREEEKSNAQIARALGVHRSTVGRELKRNRNAKSGVYDPELAQEKYKRRMREKPRHVRFTEAMKDKARDMLARQLSPEQIAGRCRLEGTEMVSHETLYRWIYGGRGRDSHLRDNLRRHGRKRQRRANRNSYRGLIPQRKDISLRPEVVEERSRLGDIEVDTVVGRGRSGIIVTMVDRASGFLWAELVPTLEAAVVCPAVTRRLLPFRGILKTLTFDNGREFSRHSDIAAALGTDNYFTRPYHSWEKGSVENANGLLRQYFRKGSSFGHLSQADVQRACDLINNRPRKRFGFLSPHEIFCIYLHRQFSQQITPLVLRL